jgi:hypothetical protein
MDGGSACRKAATQMQNTRHAMSGIRTHDPSVQSSEDNSHLRPRGHCERLFSYTCNLIPSNSHKNQFSKNCFACSIFSMKLSLTGRPIGVDTEGAAGVVMKMVPYIFHSGVVMFNFGITGQRINVVTFRTLHKDICGGVGRLYRSSRKR